MHCSPYSWLAAAKSTWSAVSSCLLYLPTLVSLSCPVLRRLHEYRLKFPRQSLAPRQFRHRRGPSSGIAASGSSSSSGSSGTPWGRASSSQSMPHLTIESLLATVKEAVEAQVAMAVASLSSSLSIPPTPAPSVPSLGEFSFMYVI